jgi:hypothetical protein
VARRIVFSRDPCIKASPKPDQEFTAAINNCLYLKNAPQFHCVVKVARNAKGTITATTVPGVDATTLLHLYCNEILNAIWEVDRGVTDVKELDKWVHLKVHGIPLNRFMGRGTQGVQKLQLEIQANHEGVEVLPGIHWLGKAGSIKERYQRGDIQCSSSVFSVKGTPAAQLLMAQGVLLGSTRYRTELYVYEGLDSQCSGCLKWGHIREQYPTPQIFRCNYCAESHPSVQYQCTLEGCSLPAGVPCEHFQLKEKYANCQGPHFSNDRKCPHRLAAITLTRHAHSTTDPDAPVDPNEPTPTAPGQPALTTSEPTDHAMANAAPPPSSTPALLQDLVVICESSEEMTDATAPVESEW